MPRNKKGEQKELPGVLEQTVEHPEITRLAEAIKALRSEWQEIGGKISKANDKLVEKMHAANLTTYVTKHFVVEIVPGQERPKIKDLAQEEKEAV